MTSLGKLIAGRPRLVVAVWALVALVGLGLAGGLSDRLANRGFGVPGSESSEARELNEQRLPDARGTRLFVALASDAPAPRVLEREAEAAAAAVAGVDDVDSVGPPLVAPDGRAAIVPLSLDMPAPEAERRIDELREAAASDRVEVAILGDAAVSERYTAIAREDLERAERLSFPAPLLLLLLAFLSVVAAALPIVSAVVSLAATFGGIFLLTLLTDMSVFATNTAIALGIGLSIDFALFTVIRFRELRAGGASTGEAVEGTVARTGRTIVVSALTVAVSLSALFVVGVGLFTSMAIGAMLATFLAAVTSVTLVPAILMLLGPRVDRLQLRRAARAASSARLWRRLGDLVVRRPAPLALAGALVLVALTLPVLSADVAVRTIAVLPEDDALRQQSDRVARSFGEGSVAPVHVLTRRPDLVAPAVVDVEGVREARPPVRGADGWSRIDVVVEHPPDSDEAAATLRRVRAAVAHGPAGAVTRVGGQTAQNVDLTERIEERTPFVIAVALLVAAIAVGIGFRSLLIPIKAVVTTALSVGASLGIVTLLFQGLGGEPALGYFVPLLLFAIVFGLSMDYEVFLLSRVREEYLASGDNDLAIRRALVATGRSITLAAAIMITVFLVFAASSLVPFQELGIGLAVAVLIDATLVRAVLVPATLALLGDLNWWLPRWRRVAPRVSG